MVIAYASQSLHPNKWKMRNNSLVKLELLALKLAMAEKLWDYLLGSKFTVYKDYNPLAYVRESKLGAAEIRWLSELALFEFKIKYWTGKSNKAADALNCHPSVPNEEDHVSESEEYETISYITGCYNLGDIIDEEKLPTECKVAIQEKSHKPTKQDLEL